jgi:hypothetical protein
MANLFSPQGPGASLSRPTGDTVIHDGADTWFKPCIPGTDNGTLITASWLNEITGNLRYLVTTAGASTTAGDDTAVYDAVQAIVGSAYSEGEGIDIHPTTFVVRSTLGMGTAELLNHETISPEVDRLQVFDNSTNQIKEIIPFNLIRSVLTTDGSVTLTADSGTGEIQLSVSPDVLTVTQLTVI